MIRWSAVDKRFPSPASCPIDMNVGTSVVPVESPQTSNRYRCCMEQRLVGMMAHGYTLSVLGSWRLSLGGIALADLSVRGRAAESMVSWMHVCVVDDGVREGAAGGVVTVVAADKPAPVCS